MRAKPVKADEQYRLVMECRSSGLTDRQWCLEHGIKPGTFYNWVKCLRKSGCQDLSASRRSQTGAHRQEIVKIELAKPEPEISDGSTAIFQGTEQIQFTPGKMDAMEISSTGWEIRIPNGTDPVLLQLALQMLRSSPC